MAVQNTSLQQDLAIYPNPNNGIFTVQLPLSNGEIKIYSISGNLVYEKTVHNTQQIDIDLHEFSNGIYLLNFVSEKSNFIKKIVKN